MKFLLNNNYFAILICLVWPGQVMTDAVAAEESGKLTVIHAGTLLSVPGKPPKSRQTILIRDGRIVEIRDGLQSPQQLSPEPDAMEIIDLSDSFILPGLIDAHVHLTLAYNGDRSVFELTGEEMLMDGVVNARATLQAGFTTVRDVGARPHSWPLIVLRDAIEAGKIPGPRVFAAGNSISATGGHADYFDWPDHMLEGLETPGLCDDTGSCRRAVRRQFRQGADLIKINATGGGGERNGGRDDPPAFFTDEFATIVETARSLNLKVAAHAHGTAGINAALSAGVDSIEHGSFLDEESIRLFNATGAFLVPTLSVHNILLEEIGDATGMMKERVQSFLDEHPVNVGRAYNAGVRIALGTDAGVVPHGDNAHELEWYVSVGMTNADAIVTATVNAAELLGIENDAGTLDAGKSADLIAVRGDPLEDIAVLKEVIFVMKSGRIFKSE